MNIKQIEAFSAVMTAGSITGGADYLNVSQPAVSRLISDLERNTGLSLFERRGKRLHPTPESYIFFEEVKKIFSGIKGLETIARNMATYATGHINIAALPALGHDFIPRVIKKFRAIYPNVTISLWINESANISNLVQNQQVDIGIVGVLTSKVEKGTALFVDTNCVCVLPKGHKLAKKKTIEPIDLANESFISYTQFTNLRNNIDKVFEEANIPRIVDIETQFTTTICNLIGHGLGISLIGPLELLEPNSLELVVKRFTPNISIKYVTVIPLNRPQSSIAVKFIEILNAYRDEELIRIENMLQ